MFVGQMILIIYVFVMIKGGNVCGFSRIYRRKNLKIYIIYYRMKVGMKVNVRILKIF